MSTVALAAETSCVVECDQGTDDVPRMRTQNQEMPGRARAHRQHQQYCIRTHLRPKKKLTIRAVAIKGKNTSVSVSVSVV